MQNLVVSPARPSTSRRRDTAEGRREIPEFPQERFSNAPPIVYKKHVGSSVPWRYPITTWTFGDDLAMVFLPGEVTVDYALRLKRELDGSRLWVTAYANAMPCYICSKRLLGEGGYEVDSSMVSYGQPSRLAPEAEDTIIREVKALVPSAFAKKVESSGE